MAAVAFDTLKLARKLRDAAHMSQEQAEGVADALAEAMSGAELATKGDIRELDLKMETRFQAVETRFQAVEIRLGSVEGRVDTIEQRLEAIETRLVALEGRMTALEARLATLEGQFVTLEARLAALEGQVTALQGQFTTLQGQFATFQGQLAAIDGRFVMVVERIERRAAEGDARMIRYVVGTGVVLVLTILGTVVGLVRYLVPLTH